MRQWCLAVAATRKRAYIDQHYWGRPVQGFGDPGARLWIVGLAPAAHGANRTGRMFTGDSSGDWLYRTLHTTGFASQPLSRSKDDGLELHGAWVSSVCRCAPPDNKPLPEERRNCAGYLERELALLAPSLTVMVALGAIAWEGCLALLAGSGAPLPRPRPRFAHGAEFAPGARFPTLIGSYHPSRQNTSTRRLTQEMLDAVFARARVLSF